MRVFHRRTPGPQGSGPTVNRGTGGEKQRVLRLNSFAKSTFYGYFLRTNCTGYPALALADLGFSAQEAALVPRVFLLAST